MNNATEVRPTTCPSWCERDHEAAERWHREIVELMIASGMEEDTSEFAALCEESERDDAQLHEAHFAIDGGQAVTLTHSPADGFEIFVDVTKGVNAGFARRMAVALLAAADKLDEIEAGR